MTGNPYDSPYVKDLVDGKKKSRNELAAGHPDLRQSAPGTTNPLGRLRTQRGNVQDQKPFASDITPGGFSHAGEVALRLFDAAGNAGAHGALHPPASPLRPADHTARDGASNGTHSDDDPRSHAVPTGVPSGVSSSPRAAANAQEAHPDRGVSHNFAYGDAGPHLNVNPPCDAVQSQAVANKQAFLDAIKVQARNSEQARMFPGGGN